MRFHRFLLQVLTAGILLSKSFFTNAQILKVNVYEVSDHYIVDSMYTEKDIIEKTYNDKGKLRIVNTSYVFDLTNNRFYYYHRGKLETEGEILVRNLGQSQIVSFLIYG